MQLKQEAKAKTIMRNPAHFHQKTCVVEEVAILLVS